MPSALTELPAAAGTYLLVVVVVAGERGGASDGEAVPPEEGGGRGAACGGESGRERRPWRHFVEQVASLVTRAAAGGRCNSVKE
jgi:hypothetical protein